jgi:hypothetical protein
VDVSVGHAVQVDAAGSALEEHATVLSAGGELEE